MGGTPRVQCVTNRVPHIPVDLSAMHYIPRLYSKTQCGINHPLLTTGCVVSNKALVGELLAKEQDGNDTAPVINIEDFTSSQAVLARLAGQRTANLRLPQIYNRKKVEQGFLQAFESIGGVSRLALWANEHPTEFYVLLSKLFPKEIEQKVKGSIVVQHALARNAALDGEEK